MTSNKNFKWLENDIDNTLVLKVVHNINGVNKFYGIFNVMDVLDTVGEELDVETANIDDLTNLLTLGIVRFANVIDNSDILDIPVRKLYLLYKEGNKLGDKEGKKVIPFDKLELFSVINGDIQKVFSVMSMVVNDVSDDLNEVMKIASEFGEYGMQEKFDALSRVNLINHRRLIIGDEEKRVSR